MKSIFISACSLVIFWGLNACQKSEFLNKKPSTGIVAPTTLSDFTALLDNTVFLNCTGGLGQLSADEYVVSDANWQTATATERNAYIWAKDIYAGDLNIPDWNGLYTQVFYANSVLDGLSRSDSLATGQGQYIKGWALFTRAFAFYDIARTFCKSYHSNTAATDLGIPLRLSPGIDNVQQRATLQQTYDQILSDLKVAATLLPISRPASNFNRPSRSAAYALLARIYLDMNDYVLAESFADQSMSLYSSLIDYNLINASATTPFSISNDELIYNTRQVIAYQNFTLTTTGSKGKIPSDLINLYQNGDLRLTIYFTRGSDGTYSKKRGYTGNGNYTFTGLATDELYLIKAECLVRRSQTGEALNRLNQLLIKRYTKASFIPVTASSAAEALLIIMKERRKELVWRGTRWNDLKRLNQEGANITLSRTVNGATYTLPPNDARWVMPIPADEIALSNILQNPR